MWANELFVIVWFVCSVGRFVGCLSRRCGFCFLCFTLEWDTLSEVKLRMPCTPNGVTFSPFYVASLPRVCSPLTHTYILSVSWSIAPQVWHTEAPSVHPGAPGRPDRRHEPPAACQEHLPLLLARRCKTKHTLEVRGAPEEI